MEPAPRPARLIRKDAPSLPALLPYHSADGDVFFLADGSLGMAWEYEAPECEALPSDALVQLSARLESLFGLLPEGSVVQFLLLADRDVRGPLGGWLDGTRGDGILRDLAEARVQATERIEIVHEGVPLVSRRLRRFLTVRVWPRWPVPHFSRFLRTGLLESGLRTAWDAERRKLSERASAIENLFRPAGLRLRRMQGPHFVDLAFRLLNPARTRETPPPRDRSSRPLRERIAFSHLDADLEDGSIRIDGIFHRVLSAIELPRETWPGMLERSDGGGATVLDLLPEALIACNIEICPQERVRRLLAAKKRLAFCQLSSGDAKVDMSAMKQEVDSVLHDMFVEGARVLSARLHVVVRDGDADRAHENARAAVNALSSVGLGMVEEHALAPTLFLQVLPLAYDPANDRALRRGRRLLAPNLAHLLPVYGSFRGTSSPDLLLLNRRGEPVTFSFFDSDVAPHAIVAGVSGAGKSVYANNLILSTARRGSSVFVLDRGNSYRKLCGTLGGTYVAFDPLRPRSINPCGRALDEERKLFLADIVAEMCTQGTRDLTVKERSLVTRAIPRAFRGSEVLLSDIREALLKDGEPAARDLAICLEPFCGDGPYAGFFDRPREVDFSGGLTVFELGDIARRRDVAGVLLMALIHNITDFCARNSDRQKYLLVDEAWTLLKTDNTAQFLEDVLRTYRKLNTSAVMITQQVSDFDGRTGTAIRANAPNRVFLRQTPETVLAMERLLDLSVEEKELLSGLVTVKGRFSEMLILSPNAKGIARLFPDPLSYWITTSDPADNARLDERVRRHRDLGAEDPLREGLLEMAREAKG